MAVGQWDRLSVAVKSNGTFLFTGLRSGPYTFMAIAEGFCQTNEVTATIANGQIANLSLILGPSEERRCYIHKNGFLPTVLQCFSNDPQGSADMRLHASTSDGQPPPFQFADITLTDLATKQQCKLKHRDLSATLDVIGLRPGSYELKVDPAGAPGHITVRSTTVENDTVSDVSLVYEHDGKKSVKEAGGSAKKR